MNQFTKVLSASYAGTVRVPAKQCTTDKIIALRKALNINTRQEQFNANIRADFRKLNNPYILC